LRSPDPQDQLATLPAAGEVVQGRRRLFQREAPLDRGGRSRPAAATASRRRNSSRLPMVEPWIWICRMNTRCSSAGGSPPVVAPQVTTRPPRRTERSDCPQVAAPTLSTTRSTPAPPVSARTRFGTSSVR
jgi:hypothetical protein